MIKTELISVGVLAFGRDGILLAQSSSPGIIGTNFDLLIMSSGVNDKLCSLKLVVLVTWLL